MYLLVGWRLIRRPTSFFMHCLLHVIKNAGRIRKGDAARMGCWCPESLVGVISFGHEVLTCTGLAMSGQGRTFRLDAEHFAVIRYGGTCR